MTYEPKILLIDIETAPSLGWYFDKYKENNILEVEQDWYIISFAYKWYKKGKIEVFALPDFPLYKRDKKSDYQLVAKIYELLEAADIVIGHNGDKFDIKKINARLIFHRFTPPAPYKTADTLKIARRVQDSGSNRLDSLARYYGIGRKLPHTGTHLWLSCLRGDPKAWDNMRKYNKHDVHLLDKLYPLLLPWAPTHPNLTLYTGRLATCPRCLGASLQKRGYRVYHTRIYQGYYCKDCGYYPTGEPIQIKANIKMK